MVISATPDPGMLNEVAVFPVRIAIVEDEPSVAEALQDLLLSRGYDVEVYNCPVRALRALTLERFDGLLLDYRMPALNGRQFFEKARRRGIVIPTVLVSGFVDETRLTEMVNLGLCRFLQKPARSEALFETLESLGVGPRRALARRAEWEEWRDHWRALIRVDETSARKACLAGVPWKRLHRVPTDSAQDRNLICSILHRWETSGCIALAGPRGADFEPFLQDLLPVVRPNVKEIAFLEGTAPGFSRRAAHPESGPTLHLGVFRDLEALRNCLSEAAPGSPAVGYILESSNPATFQTEALFSADAASAVLPPLCERPEALVHYLRAEGIAKNLDRGGAQALFGYSWPGNYLEFRAVVDALRPPSSTAPLGGEVVVEALRRVSALPAGVSFPPDSVRHRLCSDILGAVLDLIPDNRVVAALAGMREEWISAARCYREALSKIDPSPFAQPAGHALTLSASKA